ncbi:MAG: YnbE family lipoprotein [Alphaproteobacteria bacterium]|nr:YnbE family lipoprotein [Alphaproteobacteria bacterium]
MRTLSLSLLPVLAFIVLAACTPTVQVQAPDKPIEINLNVNIEQRVKIEIEKDVKQAISKNKDIF